MNSGWQPGGAWRRRGRHHRGVITGDAEGALLGAAAGAAAGAIIAHVTDRPGYCYARDPYGQTVVIQCPQGY